MEGAWLGGGAEPGWSPSASVLTLPSQLGFPLVPGSPSFLHPISQKLDTTHAENKDQNRMMRAIND